jgi:hypothetical protein
MKDEDRSRLARLSVRASVFAAAVLALGACDVWVGDQVPSIPADRTWQVLPLRAFLTRPTIRADAIQFCRVATCGFDAAVARFTATGAEAEELAASLLDRKRLEEMIRAEAPTSAANEVNLEVAEFSAGAWKGVSVLVAGGKKDRRAYGIILQRPSANDRAFVIVVAPHADLARRLALAAAP